MRVERSSKPLDLCRRASSPSICSQRLSLLLDEKRCRPQTELLSWGAELVSWARATEQGYVSWRLRLPHLPSLTFAHSSQLYTTAIAARPSSQLVALCDVNEERMKVHQNMLKELGQPEATMYAGVSQLKAASLDPGSIQSSNKADMRRTSSKRCSKRRTWTYWLSPRSTLRMTSSSSLPCTLVSRS